MRPSPLALVLFASLLVLPAAHAETQATERLTESQVRSLIEAIGYTQVSGLHADGQGLWHGRASRNGEPRDVSLDGEGIFHDAWEIGALTMFDRETGEDRTAQGSR